MAKEPGPGGFDLRPVGLDLSFEEEFGRRVIPTLTNAC